MDTNVMIFGEVLEGRLSSISKELLGGARKLANAFGEEVEAVFIGEGLTVAASEACDFGADKAFIVDDPKLAEYDAEVYVKILEGIVKEKRPRILLFGHTLQGAEVGPRLAFRLDRGIATDCTELSIEPDTNRFLRTKPVYGGMAMGTFTSEDFPQLATMRPKALPPAVRRDQTQNVVLTLNAEPGGDRHTRLLEKVTEEVAGVRLEDADVVVAGGRGIQGKEGFLELETVAKFLKGAVGATRVPCDSDWVPSTLQVGLTGKIVAPKVYIAVGISGASQHMTGCSRSQYIVAINKDPAAPIFRMAQFGVVGDWKVVLPAFIEKLKSLE
jgi:electron transfer flavoprotein alpha subunit